MWRGLLSSHWPVYHTASALGVSDCVGLFLWSLRTVKSTTVVAGSPKAWSHRSITSIPPKHCTKGCAFLQPSRQSPDRSRRKGGINLLLLECETTNLGVPLGRVFLQCHWGLEKPQSYQKKVRSELKRFLIQTNPIQVYSRNTFFLSKDKTLIERYKKYSLEKKMKLWKITKYQLLWFNLNLAELHCAQSCL